MLQTYVCTPEWRETNLCNLNKRMVLSWLEAITGYCKRMCAHIALLRVLGGRVAAWFSRAGLTLPYPDHIPVAPSTHAQTSCSCQQNACRNQAADRMLCCRRNSHADFSELSTAAARVQARLAGCADAAIWQGLRCASALHLRVITWTSQ